MKSVYQMLRVEETERVEDIFCQMDSDADGVVTLQEFIDSCFKDSRLLELLTPNMSVTKTEY